MAKSKRSLIQRMNKKSAKATNRSETKVSLLQRMYNKSAIKNLVIYDGKCFERLQHQGIDYDSPYSEGFMDYVIKQVFPWQVWLAVFESDGEKYWVTDLIPDDIPPRRCNDYGEHIDQKLRKLVETRNQKHVISWGWCAVAVDNVDLNDLRDQMIEVFKDAGAFDLEHCNAVHSARVESERIHKVAVNE